MLIDRYFVDVIILNSIADQLFAKALPPCLGGNKEHFQRLPIYTHESNWADAAFSHDNEVGNCLQHIRDIALDMLYFWIG